MNKVVLYIATSLDGFIADQDGGVNWLPHPEDPEDALGFKALLDRISIIAMGSHSYSQILGFGEWAWPDKQTYVFTSQTLPAACPNVFFTQDTPKSFIENVRRQQIKGDIWLLGGAQLAQSFAAEGLIDECIITEIPMKLGKGIELGISLDDFALSAVKLCMNDIVQKSYLKRGYMIKIDLLKNHPQTIPRLIEIWQEGIGNQWLPDYCVSRVGDKLHEHLNENSLPLTFVALADDEPAGMCSLRENDGIKPDFIYKQLSEDALSKMGWLGTLVVTSAYQKQGIAQTLIDAVKNKAQELGLEKLYLFAFDPTIPEYYTRLGWRTIGMDEFAGKPVTVMEIRVVAV